MTSPETETAHTHTRVTPRPIDSVLLNPWFPVIDNAAFTSGLAELAVKTRLTLPTSICTRAEWLVSAGSTVHPLTTTFRPATVTESR